MSVREYRRELARIGEGAPLLLELFEPDEPRLRDAMTKLADEVQTLLALLYGEGCTYEEAASILGCDVGRARELHVEAVHRVRAQLPAPPAQAV